MDNHDYDDVSNPILDLAMYGVIGDDDAGSNMDPQDHDETLSDNMEDPPLVDQVLQQEQEQEECPDDHDYGGDDLDVVLYDLRHICNEQGVPCTGPMEQMVKIKHGKETIFYSGLVWFVRGIALANQTQIIPTVVTAINDMKMETKLLQQSSSRINKEVEKAGRLTGDIVEELNNIKEKMQDSFRDSIQKFLETHSKIEPAKVTDHEPTIGESMSVNRKRNKEGVSGKPPPPADPVTLETEEIHPKAEKVIEEKKKMLIKIGFKPSWIKDIGDDLIDVIYDDELHASVMSVRLTQQIKKYVTDSVKENLNNLLADE
ncbi:MAG: phosphoprotein [Pastinaca cytorhabdovirus 1]|uniref:Phosphoprotein n=1 Tax=Pastinaca cytorhabdovirus 1 TaxID=2950847 RepID=A0AAE9MRL2_9RHAB|nr:MAG: phosphoprotein [Pastinaca cytorhabdovirus 1]